MRWLHQIFTSFKKDGVYEINPDSIYCGKITDGDNDKALT